MALTLFLGLALCLATYTGWEHYQSQQRQRLKYKAIVRAQWLAKPDKHPHRMAHYGYLVFRDQHELSFFDFGIESFAGVSIFLEAHKQNTANFSEAGFSGGMLRFGEMSVAMVLQLLVPLLIFFLGYNAISAERESGTLKILLCQGISWEQLLAGKTLGIIGVVFTLFLPVMLLTMLGWAVLSNGHLSADAIQRFGLLLAGYTMYFSICAGVAVWVSACCSTSKVALTILLAGWVCGMMILPRLTQAIGVQLHPAPARIEFAANVEKELHRQGDSHNPDDPHYAKLKDSLLQQYKVTDVKQLPFNYGGYVMAEGERISAAIYNRHQQKLTDSYQKQNSFTIAAGYLNPYLAIRYLSMALTAADFDTYADFQDQAEAYRYQLAQQMNKLQMKYISNATPGDTDKPATISHTHWASMPDFQYHFKPVAAVVRTQAATIGALLCWLALIIGCFLGASKWAKSL
ncbi:ABC transporter permease [Chitinophaga nivalis]|uniref:DUF3526 domain-containing protein n=2 Tax=Chitinophaga nivalis TaxID=2991709 RepID=A0ABT3IJW0_9BACT|nr:DUF3526 domain-containing protein [Chitinophaga nivalis]MCW3484260.1 DUF3526 domain-containing protein [Chitinophaga nivalis]